MSPTARPGLRRPMTTRHRRIVGAVAVALLAAPVIALNASASDGSPPTVVSVAASPLAAVKAASKTGTATFTLTARITDAAGVVRAFVGMYGPNGALPEGRSVPLTRTAGTAKDGTWTQKVTMKKADPVGTWQLRAFAQDADGNMTDADRVYGGFDLKDATRFASFDVGPEPVAAGGKVTVAGRLERYQAGKGWVALSGRTVRLEFRGTGAPAYVPVVTRKTDKKGSFATSSAATATAGGSWRMTFPGDATRAAATSSEDAVKIG
jgi:hypothetical protein